MSVKKHIKAELKGGVLVLNQSYEPLRTSPLTRVMLKLSKPNSCYTVEEWNDEPLHRPDGTPERKPSVVRLKEYLNLAKLKSKGGSRKEIYQRDKYKCQFCAKKFTEKDLTLDHVYPKSRGGSNDATNLVTACKECNNRKGDRTPEEAGMPLVSSPTSYKQKLHWVKLCHYAEARPDWQKYLFMDSNGDEKFAHVA